MENSTEESKKISTALLVFNAVLLLSIIGMVFAIYAFLHRPVVQKENPQQQAVVAKLFASLNLQAKSVYVFDVSQNEIIYEQNQNAELPLASLTKLVMALTATDLAPDSLKITIQKPFLAEDGDNGLLPGETWTLKNLLNFSLIVSSNDGARAIASTVGDYDLKSTDIEAGRKDFIQKMNDTVKSLGLTQTYFVNENGLDESATQSGGYGSAEDVGKLLQYILQNKLTLLEATKEQSGTFSSSVKAHKAVNTDLDVSKIPGLLASKTGYTELAGGNLAVAFDASIGRPIIVVVLGSTEDARFTDVVALVKASLAYVSSK